MFVIWLGVILAILIPIFTVDGGLGSIISYAVSNNMIVGLDFTPGISNPYSFWGCLLYTSRCV